MPICPENHETCRRFHSSLLRRHRWRVCSDCCGYFRRRCPKPDRSQRSLSGFVARLQRDGSRLRGHTWQAAARSAHRTAKWRERGAIPIIAALVDQYFSLLPAIFNCFFPTGAIDMLIGFFNTVILCGLLGAFNEDRLTWHDEWAGTAVWKRRRPPPLPAASNAPSVTAPG